MDARTLKKEDIQKETVYCLNDDDETEVSKEDTIQGMMQVSALSSKRDFLQGDGRHRRLFTWRCFYCDAEVQQKHWVL